MEKKVRRRSLAVGLFFLAFVLCIVGKLYWVQIVEASRLTQLAEKTWQDDEVLRAKRGMILDRNDKPLAEDAPAYNVALQPEIINKFNLAGDIAKGLAPILSSSADAASTSALEKKIFDLATKKKQDSNDFLAEVQVRIEGWKIDGDTKQKVDDFIAGLEKSTGHKSVGITLYETEKRYYPLNSIASHVLGYMDKDGKAVMGLEASLNDTLSGKNGSLERQRDKMGIEIPDSKVTLVPPVNGKNVKLTIDRNIQYYVENALQKAQDEWHPKAMMAVVADPQTMDILALANKPDFNPNRYWEIDDQKDYINRAISSQYEPGSTFKLVTLAGTIEEGIFHPQDTYQSGFIKVPGRTLHDWDPNGWGRISFMDGLLRSSNVAFVRLGYFGLGKDRLAEYINKFGFGQKTGIDLPSEIPGTVSMKWDSDYATATYGQGKVLTTAMQLTAAYAAIANGGKLMEPHVIKEILDPVTGKPVETVQPKVVRQVVSAQTAEQAALDLEQVVANQEIGTGKKAYLNGYRVAGKTGTANIVPEGQNKYSEDTWLISFIGFAPVEHPQLLMTIMLDQPDLGGDFHKGSEAWAPIFRDVMTQSLNYLGIGAAEAQKKAVETTSLATVPDLHNTAAQTATNKLSQLGLQAEVLGTGKQVLQQYPAAGTEIALTQRILLLTQDAKDVPVPDFRGKSMREALEVCSFLGLACQTNGEGYVTGQSVQGDGAAQTVTLQLAPADRQADASPSPAKGADAAAGDASGQTAAGNADAAKSGAARENKPAQSAAKQTSAKH